MMHTQSFTRFVYALVFAVVAFALLTGLTGPVGPVLAQEIVIEYWHPYGPPWDEGQNQAAALFNERYKGRVRVEAKSVPDLYTKLPVAIASGTGPDAAHVTGIARVIEYADRGLVEPLDGPLSRNPAWDPDDLFPGFYETYRYNGKLYGLPGSAQPTSLVWSKQAFREVGLDPDRGPATHEEFDHYIRQLTQTNPDNSLDRVGYLYSMWGGFLNFAYHWGASFFDKEQEQITITNEPAVEALDWLVRLYDSYGGTAAVNEFLNRFRTNVSSGVISTLGSDPLYVGRQGMATYSHYHYYAAHTNAPDWEYGFSQIPPLGPPSAAPKAPIVHTDGEVVLSGTDHATEAALYIHFKTLDPQARRATVELSAHPAASISVNRMATVEGWVPDWYPMELWLQNFDVLAKARPWPETPIVNDLSSLVGAAYSRAITGQMAVRPSLEEAQRLAEARLAEWKARRTQP